MDQFVHPHAYSTTKADIPFSPRFLRFRASPNNSWTETLLSCWAMANTKGASPRAQTTDVSRAEQTTHGVRHNYFRATNRTLHNCEANRFIDLRNYFAFGAHCCMGAYFALSSCFEMRQSTSSCGGPICTWRPVAFLYTCSLYKAWRERFVFHRT